jgi:hypothetical protein
MGASNSYSLRHNIAQKKNDPIKSISKVSHFEGDDHLDSTGMARFHMNQGNLYIWLVHIVDRDPLEVFSGCPIRNEVLGRPFIEEGLSRASCGVLTCVVECVNVL